jgi:cell division protein DivIC
MNLISFWKNLKKNNKTLLIYASISLGFLIWMLFLDTHSWTIHSELNQEIEKLEKEKKVLKETLTKDNQAIEILQNPDSLARFAREKYGHKKSNETVFIIEPQDSLN